MSTDKQLRTEAHRLVTELKGYSFQEAGDILGKALSILTSMVAKRDAKSTLCSGCGNFSEMLCDVCEKSGATNGAYYNTETGRFICPKCRRFGRRLERKLQLKNCCDRTAPYCTCEEDSGNESESESEE